ncbi:hypothetical protein ABEB36_001098 [Hypothenemus hampei]|uniref:Uncharacterized protein n=1 Tax=Hypothenemus hampei TaxID=57062 RepID=A0ABD1FDG7_HYPHA
MRSQFIQQVQLLMETQHIKYTESLYGKPHNYMWLCSKKPHMVYWMSTKDEIKIRNCLDKITQQQEIKVLKQVLSYLDRNPNVSPATVPEITLLYLNDIITCNFFEHAKEEINVNQNFKPFHSRMSSFRNSFRKLGILGNKKLLLQPPRESPKPRRSVTFDEVPKIYQVPVQ